MKAANSHLRAPILPEQVLFQDSYAQSLVASAMTRNDSTTLSRRSHPRITDTHCLDENFARSKQVDAISTSPLKALLAVKQDLEDVLTASDKAYEQKLDALKGELQSASFGQRIMAADLTVEKTTRELLQEKLQKSDHDRITVERIHRSTLQTLHHTQQNLDEVLHEKSLLEEQLNDFKKQAGEFLRGSSSYEELLRSANESKASAEARAASLEDRIRNGLPTRSYVLDLFSKKAMNGAGDSSPSLIIEAQMRSLSAELYQEREKCQTLRENLTESEQARIQIGNSHSSISEALVATEQGYIRLKAQLQSQKVCRALKFWRTRRSHRTWYMFQHWAFKNRYLKRKVQTCRMKRDYHIEKRAFIGWSDQREESKVAESLAKADALEEQLISLAADKYAQERVLTAELDKERASRIFSKTLTFIQRWKKAHLMRAWNRWLYFIDLFREALTKLHRAMRVSSHSVFCHPIEIWKSWTNRKQGGAAAIQSRTDQMQTISISSPFHRWRRMCNMSIPYATFSESLSENKVLLQCRRREVKTLIRALHQWCAWVHRCVRNAAISMRRQSFLRSRLARIAFECWFDETSDSTNQLRMQILEEQLAAEKALQSPVNVNRNQEIDDTLFVKTLLFLRDWKSSRSRRAWTGWFQYFLKKKTYLVLYIRASKSSKHISTKRSMHSWMMRTRHGKCCRRSFHLCAEKIGRSSMRNAIAVWLHQRTQSSGVLHINNLQRVLAYFAEERVSVASARITRNQQNKVQFLLPKLAKIFCVWTALGLRKAFSAWRGHLIQSSCLRECAVRMITRLNKDSVCRAFKSWETQLSRKIRWRKMLGHFSQKYLRSTLKMCYFGWLEHRSNSAQVLAHEERSTFVKENLSPHNKHAMPIDMQQKQYQSILFIVSSWQKNFLRKCWNAWYGNFVHGKVQKESRVRSIRRWLRSSLAKCFSCLHDWAVMSSRCRRILAIMMGKLGEGLLSESFLAWAQGSFNQKIALQRQDAEVLRRQLDSVIVLKSNAEHQLSNALSRIEELSKTCENTKQLVAELAQSKKKIQEMEAWLQDADKTLRLQKERQSVVAETKRQEGQIFKISRALLRCKRTFVGKVWTKLKSVTCQTRIRRSLAQRNLAHARKGHLMTIFWEWASLIQQNIIQNLQADKSMLQNQLNVLKGLKDAAQKCILSALQIQEERMSQ